MRRSFEHVKALWGRFWFIPLCMPAYAATMFVIGDLRPEHVVFSVVTLILAFASLRSKRFLVDVAPYIAVAIGYDLVRYIRPLALSPERVLGCELRNAEL